MTILNRIIKFIGLPLPETVESKLDEIKKELVDLEKRVHQNTMNLHLQNGEGGFPGIDTTTSVNILTYILEDDEEIHEVIKDILQKKDFKNYLFFSDPAQFLENLTADINICVLDHYLTGTTGLKMIKEVKAKNKNSYVIVVSGQRNFNIAIQYLNEGADKYIDKDTEDYIFTLVSYLEEGLNEASRRVAIVKYLEEKMKHE